MTKTAHVFAGATTALFVGLSLNKVYPDAETTNLLLLGVAVIVGSTAPDLLEIPYFSKILNKRISLIPHRTITHWILPWVAVMMFSAEQAFNEQMMTSVLLFGFSLGGVIHLIQDLLTPAGIPILIPFLTKNKSLYLVKGLIGELLFSGVYASTLTYVYSTI